jgi:hypothetical protein
MRTTARAGVTTRGAQVLRALTCAGALSHAAGVAVAQEEPQLAEHLTAGLQCAYADPEPRLETNIANSGAGPLELLSALTSIFNDYRTCDAIKSAVGVKLGELSGNDEVLKHQEIVLARQRMESALREADQSAATMRFVVGPPPPRLTRNRSSVP